MLPTPGTGLAVDCRLVMNCALPGMMESWDASADRDRRERRGPARGGLFWEQQSPGCLPVTVAA
jgi:hypothetical protein